MQSVHSQDPSVDVDTLCDMCCNIQRALFFCCCCADVFYFCCLNFLFLILKDVFCFVVF